MLLFGSYGVGAWEGGLAKGYHNFSPFFCIPYALTHNLLTIILVLAFIYIIIGLLHIHREDLRQENIIKRKISTESTAAGSERMATEDEIREMVEYRYPSSIGTGWPLGKNYFNDRYLYVLDHPEKLMGNGFDLIIGASGKGKSVNFTANMFLQDLALGRSCIMTDPKMDQIIHLYEIAKKYVGDNVWIINWSEAGAFAHSDGFNILRTLDVNDRTTCHARAAEIAELYRRIGLKSDDHWSDVTENLCLALELIVAEESLRYENEQDKNETCSLRHIMQMLIWGDKQLRIFMNQIPETSVAFTYARIFVEAPDFDRIAARNSLFSVLNIVAADAVGEALTHNDVDIRKFANEQCVLFLVFTTKQSPYDILTATFFDQAFTLLEREAKQNFPSNSLKVPVHFILDEFPALGTIPSFGTVIDTVRGYGIHISMLIQNVGQVYERYGKNAADSFMGQCSVKIYLGSGDKETRQWVQDHMGVGETTIEVEMETTRYNRGFGVKRLDASARKSYTKGYVMTLDELETMYDDQMAVLIRFSGKHPFMAHKFMYIYNPLYEKLEPYNPLAHVPLYLRNVS